MNAMLTDTELERLLEEAAGSFVVPAPDLEVPAAPGKRLWQRRWPQAGAAAAVLVAGSLLLSTVDVPGSSSSADRSTPSVLRPVSPGSSLDQGATMPGSAQVAGPPARRTSGQVATGSPAQGGAGLSGGTGGTAAPAAPGDRDTSRIIRTGSIQLAVDEGKVRAVVVALENLVVGFHGYEADSTSNEFGDSPSATLTFRVPVSSFPALIQRVRALNVEVVSVTQAGKDVTASYADTQAQIQSLRAARARYLVILSRARTIGETLTVQQRVDDVQQQIDRLEGQRRVLADQSDFATLTVSVAEEGADEAFAVEERSGWSKAWDDAKHGFSSGVQSLIAHSGRTLLVLIVGAALLLLGRTGWRLARRRLV